MRDAMTGGGTGSGGADGDRTLPSTPAQAGHSAAEQALAVNPRITALLCTTDVLALGALDYARWRGLDVPGQLSITGFDGVDDALREGLTTVRQPAEEKGGAPGGCCSPARTPASRPSRCSRPNCCAATPRRRPAPEP